jgi:DNA polymerase-3 subunit gamma/tau
MTYTVLARKYRPRSFDTFVGQDPVVRTLKNAIQNERLHHAYFLTGTRGVGKTTLGRLIAKCFNCEKGISATPCGSCSSCQEIDAAQSLDLIEIDAASNTKVEDTRELLNNVQYAPTRDRFKIYLIDEVHMLSGHSFNALLKTLEEPPTHVKFILATTDPQKLPITILSRCLQFHLKNMLPEVIAQQLQTVCEQENVIFESLALRLVSEAAEGSMRDALSLLDQALAYGNNQVLLADVESMLGSVKKTALFELIQQLGSKQGAPLIASLEKLILQGGDCQALLESLLSFFHALLLIKVVPAAFNSDPTLAGQYRALGELFTAVELEALYQIGVQGRRDLPWAPTARIGLEMILLRMLSRLKLKPADKHVADVEGKLPSVKEQFPPLIEREPLPANKSTSKLPQPPEIRMPFSESPAPTTTDSSLNWAELIPHLNLTGLTLSLAEHCALKSFKDNKLALQIEATHAPLAHEAQRKRLQEKLHHHFQKAIVLEIITGNTIASPAQEKKQILDADTQVAEAKLAQDPIAQQLIKTFSATIQTGSTTLIK